MAKAGVDALVIPSDDPHLSEYVASCFERRAFVSGFTGSAGAAVVFADDLDNPSEDGAACGGLVWTDGRYHLQAEKELGPGWGLMKSGNPGVPEVAEYLASHVAGGGTVGVDPSCHSAASCEALRRALAAKGVALTFTTAAAAVENDDGHGGGEDGHAAGEASLGSNWVDEVWGSERPPLPVAPLRVHSLDVAGKTPQDKLQELRQAVKQAGADATMVASLDEVAWLLNLRGADVECNPVFLSYVLVGPETATLFVDPAKVTQDVARHLAANGVEVLPYESASEGMREAVEVRGWRVLGDPNRLNAEMWSLVPAPMQIVVPPPPGAAPGQKGNSPLAEAKSVKNACELAGMEAAHVRDGAAVACFFAWLFETVHSPERATASLLDEVDIDETVTQFRKELSPRHFVGLSFPTIAGADGHGAIVHYRASREDPENFPVGHVGPDTMLLLDSGAQYLDGTTDVTRTIHLGDPTPLQREAFTRVLKGHIGVDSCTFPEGTPGFVLDVLARKSLWEAGMDYAHGTGHGVGAGLNVHEGPMGIAPRYANLNTLKPGMVISNEPGFYHTPPHNEKGFGIRIENLLQIVAAEPKGPVAPLKKFLKFKRLTQIPIQRALIDISLLTPSEVAWIDAYHEEVSGNVAPLLADRPSVLKWLDEWTRPLVAN